MTEQHTEVDCLFRACVDPEGRYAVHGWGSIREAEAENPGDVDNVLYDMMDSESPLRFFNVRMKLPLPTDGEIQATAEETE